MRDNFFHKDLGPVGNLGEGVEAWRGYHSSVRPTGLGLTLNLGKHHGFTNESLILAFLCCYFKRLFVTHVVSRYMMSWSWHYTDEVYNVSDITMTTILKAIMVEDFLKERFNKDLRELRDRDWNKAKSILKNVRVETTHMQVSRTHKITGFSDRPIRDLR